jgi:hypothetical protein
MIAFPNYELYRKDTKEVIRQFYAVDKSRAMEALTHHSKAAKVSERSLGIRKIKIKFN